MPGEVFAGLSAIKTAFDIAKGLKDIDDATRRDAAVIELQEKILSAREAQAALLDRVSELEKKWLALKHGNVRSSATSFRTLGKGFTLAS